MISTYASIFFCRHCGKKTPVNPRLKKRQKYCSKKSCQQSRKNKWEREKIKKDALYRQKRNSQKASWRKKRPSHQYQSDYRKVHPDYVTANRKKQQRRNRNVQTAISGVLPPNIVKTDSLIYGGSINSGLYEILPYKMSPGQNIVKTDSLIVELRAHRALQEVLADDSG